MSVSFLHISLSYAKRLEASTETYNKVLDKLPNDFRRTNIASLKFGRFFSARTSYVIVFLMFFSTVAVNILLTIFS